MLRTHTYTSPPLFRISFYLIIHVYMKWPLLNQEASYDYVSSFIPFFISPEAHKHLFFLLLGFLCTYYNFSPRALTYLFKTNLLNLLCLSLIFSEYVILVIIHQSHFLLESPFVETFIAFSKVKCSFGLFLLPLGWSVLGLFLCWSERGPFVTWNWLLSGDYLAVLDRRQHRKREAEVKLRGTDWRSRRAHATVHPQSGAVAAGAMESLKRSFALLSYFM